MATVTVCLLRRKERHRHHPLHQAAANRSTLLRPAGWVWAARITARAVPRRDLCFFSTFMHQWETELPCWNPTVLAHKLPERAL